MAKLDRFLSQLTAKGASSLRMEPGGYPLLEFPGGHRVNLSLQELLGTVLDGLTKEIMPEDQETTYLRGDKVTFDYTTPDATYVIAVLRSSLGTRIIATHAPPPPAPPEPAPVEEAVPSAIAGPASVFELLISHLISSGSSDLYLSSDEVPMMRTHGRVHSIEGFPAPRAQDLSELIKAIAPAKAWEDFKRDHPAEFIHLERARHCRLRISLFSDGQGPAANVRVIPNLLPSSEDLGFTEPIKRVAAMSQGLVLVCGAPGSGRTTTTMALLRTAAESRASHILSIESAVEFPLHAEGTLIRQREVGNDSERRKKAVRAALRQAPDLISVGEIQDAGMLRLALEGASTGHLVFAKLPAVSILDGLEYLLQLSTAEDQTLMRTRLASCLKAVICQALLPGYRGGRVAVFETMFVSPAIAEHLREGRVQQVPAAMKTGRAYGQRLMNESMVDLIQAKLLEPEAAYRCAMDREGFINACKKADVDFDPRKKKNS